ncbi:MAG: orotate phosphoribosyltransferase [Candidatus Saganbacteria bacterium]|nr:orotate phosphoribosyltransferase [Candidatus Saganbacteria bacterium]
MSKRDELFTLLKEKAVKIGEFTLSSGKKSNFYFDAKQATCHPYGSYLMGSLMLEEIKNLEADAIGGLTMGADPIAAVVSVLSKDLPRPLFSFMVRKEAKGHGLKKSIEGIIELGWKVIIVDDVITTAESTLKAIKAVEEIGCKVVKVMALVDREEGGTEALANYPFVPLFKKCEFF